MRDGLAGGQLLGAVKSGGAEGAVGEQHRLQHQPGIEGVFDADPPRTGGEDLASHLDEEVVLPLGAEDRRGAIGGEALQDRAEVEVQAFMALGQGEVLLVEFQLGPADLRERGLELFRRGVRQFARWSVAPEVGQGSDGDVVHAVRGCAQLQGELDGLGEFLGDAERLGGLEVVEVGGRRGFTPVREREFHAVDLGLELALQDLGVDIAAAHLDGPCRAKGGAVQFGDGLAGRRLR